MNTLSIYNDLGFTALSIGISALRIVVAFMVLPLFSNDLIPAMIRNAIFIALALLTVFVQPVLHLEAYAIQDWLYLFGKEVFVGISIGVFFGLYLWAFEAAGQIIDTQIGIATAQILDPISGHQTTLVGEFLSRFSNFIFMAVGGLLWLCGAILESYSIWPIGEKLPNFSVNSLVLFQSEFSEFLTLTLLISAPILAVTYLIDAAMGLINRYAQQFNVSFLSMSLKMFASIFILMLSLQFLIEILIKNLRENVADLHITLQGVLG